MTKKTNTSPFQLKSALTREKNICRVIAAWTLYALGVLLFTEGDFFDLSFAQDTSLTVMILTVIALFCGLTAVSAVLHEYETDSWFLLLGATGCVVRWLATYKNDIIVDVKIGSSTMKMNSDETLFLLAVIFAYSLFLFYFLQKNDLLFDSLKLHSGLALGIVAALGLMSATVIAVTTCMRYLTFTSPNFDFGLFVNMFHNMKETGLPLISSERDVLLSHFVVHISPTCYLLLPFYALFPSAMTLQIGQAVILASGIIPAILIARHYKLSNLTQVAVAIIYATFPVTSMGCFYDFHENCFLLPLLLWVFYFFEKEKYLWMYVFVVLTLGVKEDAAIYVLFFALFLIVARKKYLHGTLLALGAAAYFLIALAILEGSAAYWADFYATDTPRPSIDGPMVNRFNNLIYDKEKGLLGAILTALKNPGYLLTQFFSTDKAYLDSWFMEKSPWAKVVYVLHMLLPVGMIPFVTKKQSRWLLLAPMLLNVLTTYKYQYSISFQYHFGISAFVIYAMLLNLPDIQPIPRRRLLALGAAASCCMYIFMVLPKYNQYTDLWEDRKDYYVALETMLDDLPEDASLSVPSTYLAHVADRREVYEHTYHVLNGEKNQLKEHDVDYAVIRTGADAKYRKAFEEKGYTVWAEYDGHVILKSPHIN
jgi:uncharacterized membrane protein